MITEDLMLGGLRILKSDTGFTYGADSIALSHFVRLKKGAYALDMGCGTGFLAIQLSYVYEARFLAVDIQQECCGLAQRAVELNAQTDMIDVMCCDVRSLYKTAGANVFDAIVCNPPYYHGGTKSTDPARNTAMRDETLSVEDVCTASKRLLKNGGSLFMVYPASLFPSACAALEKNTLAVKRIRPVCTSKDTPPYVILIEAKKSAKDGAVWEVSDCGG